MAYAALGAGELLLDATAALGTQTADPDWPWPEPRLTYSNATIAEALVLAGDVLPDPVAHRVDRRSPVAGVSADVVGLDWGDNDKAVPMFDPRTCAGFDKLQCDGRNLDPGAEPTLAALATIQHVRRLVPLY